MERILGYLRRHPHVYVGNEGQCRRFLEAVLCILRSGGQWRLLPAEKGEWNSVFNRFSRWSKRDVWTGLLAYVKELRLHGMASAWADLMAQGATATESSRWLIEHLLQFEHTDRAMRSVRHQMTAAKLPVHRDLTGFDFKASSVDQALVKQLATLSFTDTAQNAVFIGGPGTGKTHLATAIAVSGITLQGKRVRFYSTVDLVNLLECEKHDGTKSRRL